jgi:DNA-binding MarR family transcriptional regulator
MVSLLVDASERFLGEALGRLDAAGFQGLSVSQAFAVQLIESGVATITALSEAMRMTPQAVSAIVNQLEERGYVLRGRREQDARAKVLTLTEAGARLAAEVATALHEVEREWADLVGDERLRDVVSALDMYVSGGSRASSNPTRRRQRRVRFV